MDLHTWSASKFFSQSMVITPPIVTLFTLLRQGECTVNDLGYPELSCRVSMEELQLAGNAASKLTAAFSIHIDTFLGLSCSEIEGNYDSVIFTARFSNVNTPKDVDQLIKLRAADIIDTLMAIG